MSDLQAKTEASVHPFETPVAERVFKMLLWVVLVLQVAVFAKAYQKLVRHLPERSDSGAWRVR